MADCAGEAGEAPLAGAVSWGQAEYVRKGEDKIAMQRATVNGDSLWLLLVADGHGGRDASELAAARLLSYVVEEAGEDASALPAAAARAFGRAHAEIISLPSRSGNGVTTAGTTATASPSAPPPRTAASSR